MYNSISYLLVANVGRGQDERLGVSNVKHTHAVDAVELVQHVSLTLNALDHALDIAQSTLTYPGTLPVSDVAHANAIDQTALTQVHKLTVAAVDHAVLLDNGVLGAQVYDLTVNELTHSHTLDQSTLDQDHNLTTNPLDHAITLDEPTITEN